MLFDILSPGLRCAHPGLSRRNKMKTELTLAAPLRGLFYGKPTFYPDIEFCINILLKYFMGYQWTDSAKLQDNYIFYLIFPFPMLKYSIAFLQIYL
jgi:hypothetical protein